MGLGWQFLFLFILLAVSIIAVPVMAFFVVKFSVYAYYCGLELYERRKSRDLERKDDGF
jgi:hypothetical protein